ncbi:hypothetical protein DHEL01_v212456 [Diaporthe helianthi]|uniref:Uncharacterized protein n=1 Tax=Diaporthe helianthi TaxID=158607 RepID=A0A2P5HFX6_DIAHE|nr:hypothetical protein DHEL01_v212456 [Diaporthe helianthi]
MDKRLGGASLCGHLDALKDFGALVVRPFVWHCVEEGGGHPVDSSTEMKKGSGKPPTSRTPPRNSGPTNFNVVDVTSLT